MRWYGRDTTGFLDDNGDLVTNRKRIALNYCKSWFLIDFVSSIPYSYIVLITKHGDGKSSAAGTASLLQPPSIFGGRRSNRKEERVFSC